MTALALGLLVCALGQRPATVARVVDGDTIVVQDLLLLRVAGPSGAIRTLYEGKIRLLDVSAPEPGQPGGPEATAWMRARLPAGEAVCLTDLAMPVRLDGFGRVLARVLDSDGDVGAGIVAAGLAR